MVRWHSGRMQYGAYLQGIENKVAVFAVSPFDALEGLRTHLSRKNAPQAHTVALGRAQGGE